MPRGISDPLQEKSKLVSLLYNDPKFFYYSGNNNGSGVGQFVQTSYKYGHDRQGNGSSEQPYITTDIPRRLSTSPTDDGYIRGGWTLANQASTTDQLRINKFINDTPKGPLFIARQIGLQLTNPKLETRKINLNGFGFLGSVLTIGFNALNNTLPGPTRLYNEGKNTLAQLPVTAFGTHFERHGLSPIQDDNTKYLAVVRNNNDKDNGNNRLLALKTKLIKPGVTNPRKGNVILGTINAILGAVNVFNTAIGKGTNPLLPTSPLLQPADLIIDRYSGGPGSTYGVGFTTIRRYDVTSNGPNKPIPSKGSIDYAGALGVSNIYQPKSTPGQLVDSIFFTGINPENPTNKPKSIDQTAVDYDKKPGYNAPAGANGTSTSPTSRLYNDLINQIKTNITQPTNNGSGSFTTSNNIGLSRKPRNRDESPSYKYYGGANLFGETRYVDDKDKTKGIAYNNRDIFARTDSDILTLHFRPIYPFGNDFDGYDLRFSAYMKGFKDNFDATWNEYNYIGRAESFYTYGRFKRNVSFNFDIPCFNKTELLEKHRALGQLASTTAGSYNTAGLLGGVLLKVNVGKYLDNEYAILNNISYDIPDDSSWDVDEQLAMYLKVNVSLTIIHSKLPEYKVPDIKGNEKAGFFGDLGNPIPNGYLSPR